jgi:ribonuclease P protein component
VVVHAALRDPRSTTPARVGFVVSNAVGGAVVRNTVKRRLRAQVAARLGAIPGGTDLVVRALPAAAGATSAELGSHLDRQIARVVGTTERV